MTFTAVAIAGAAVVGAVASNSAAKKGAAAQRDAAGQAADASDRASELSVEELRAAREESRLLRQPFIDVGAGAANSLQTLQNPTLQELTYAQPRSFSETLEEVNPVVSFLRQQGFEQIQESAAAQGRLGAGGTLRDLVDYDASINSTLVPQMQQQRFNQDLALFNQQLQGNNQALGENNQNFNQLYNVATLGSNAAAGQGTASLNSAAGVSNVLSNNASVQGQAAIAAGNATANGAIGQANAITGAVSNLAGVAGAFPSLFGGGAAATPPPSAGINMGGIQNAMGGLYTPPPQTGPAF